MEDTLYRFNPWWEKGYKYQEFIDRPELLKSIKSGILNSQVIFLTGLRRVGKTTLLKILIKYLIEEKDVNQHHIFYVSLDNFKLVKYSIVDLIEEYRKIHKIKYDQKVYLFLDEVANKENFELQLKNLYDAQNVKIFTSSSSATILKSKKNYLTGRNHIIEVNPLDYNEYLLFKNITISTKDRHLHERYFEDFMRTGGIPEFVLNEDISYLKELIDDIIYKDIAGFYGVKDITLLQDFFLLLMERAGKIVSINKLAKILKISPDTARRYLDMFSNSYLIYLISRHGKTNERILAPKKLYASDLGIRTFCTGFRDKGSLFENYAFLKLKNLNPTYIYEDGNEIDFFTKSKILIEVKYKSEFNEKQEKLFKIFPCKKRLIIKNVFDLMKLNVVEN